jgi:hypothetical protein
MAIGLRRPARFVDAPRVRRMASSYRTSAAVYVLLHSGTTRDWGTSNGRPAREMEAARRGESVRAKGRLSRWRCERTCSESARRDAETADVIQAIKYDRLGCAGGRAALRDDRDRSNNPRKVPQRRYQGCGGVRDVRLPVARSPTMDADHCD